MFVKLMIGAGAVMAAALFAYLEDRLINAYGEARYQSGFAEGRLEQAPGILAASEKAAQAGLDARDRVIAADGLRDATLARLIPQIFSAQDKVTAYAASTAGRAYCLDPERVRDIETDRTALFPDTPSDPAGDGAAGSVSTYTAAGAKRP